MPTTALTIATKMLLDRFFVRFVAIGLRLIDRELTIRPIAGKVVPGGCGKSGFTVDDFHAVVSLTFCANRFALLM
jgi:hypothetical protein